LAEEATAACGGVACAINWQSARDAGLERVPEGLGWRAPLNSLRALVERQLENLSPAGATFPIEAGQLAPIFSARLTAGRALAGMVWANGQVAARVTVILLAPLGRRSTEFEALARLVGRRALGIITEDEIAASRDFWREQASATGERLGAAHRELTELAAERATLEALANACRKLKPRKRFAGLGTMIAGAGPFAAWLTATPSDGKLQVVAASTAFVPIPPLDSSSALADCVRRNEVIVHRRVNQAAEPAQEDRSIAGFRTCAYVPLRGAAVVLASREELGPAVVSRLEQVAVRLAPLVETWLAEEEIARLQRLVRSLGMRMFGAIDGERQRIARDLHDHLAQLIAASRIALAADPQGASGILKQLDEALRLRVRELRPATLGRSTLREALRYEIHRMGDAGIKARLLHPEWTKRLPRAIQELCYQVSREAISNVIRHAGATRVEMTTERRRGRVFLRIDDNGKGLSVRTDATNGGAHGAGMGLRGMAERLELMGGQLKLERLAGVTRLTAEIPER
jgi:signal transduction histidine kinase